MAMKQVVLENHSMYGLEYKLQKTSPDWNHYMFVSKVLGCLLRTLCKWVAVCYGASLQSDETVAL